MKGFPVPVRKERDHAGRVDFLPRPPADVPLFEEIVEVDPINGTTIQVVSKTYMADCGCLVKSKEQLGGICRCGMFVCRDHYDLCIGRIPPRPGLWWCCRKMRVKVGWRRWLFWLLFGEGDPL